jgi:hypothetical protein
LYSIPTEETVILLLLTVIACSSSDKIVIPTEGIENILVDSDGDGYTEEEDCDDESPTINPGIDEICDGIDNNCDGVIDEGVESIFYLDEDQDGYGDEDNPVSACSAPTGYVPNANDCDDQDELAYPGAIEICDDIDNNCDGTVDEGLIDTWYIDNDGDGFGSSSNSVYGCEPDPPSAAIFVNNGDDCDDDDIFINPYSAEICDEVDNDCDGTIDEDVQTVYYHDQDSDGFGDTNQTFAACEPPDEYIETYGDCNDINSAINPNATEVCNDNIDNDCDTLIDDPSAIDASVWYLDTDGDGYGNAATSIISCSQPQGYTNNPDDCLDTDATVNPSEVEVCDGIDNDCNGSIDGSDAIDATYWYLDNDGDGFGGSTVQLSCSQPLNHVSNSDDCNDYAAAIRPGGSEICNSQDDDCNGLVDDNATNTTAWYLDADGDGFGTINNIVYECSAPSSSYVTNNTDCDDLNAQINPTAVEICNLQDDNCNGFVDDNSPYASQWYLDSDCDGFGDPLQQQTACQQPTGYVASNADCDDSSASISPSSIEVCSSPPIDHDCDGSPNNNCAMVIELPMPSEPPLESPISTGSCGLFSNSTSTQDTHVSSNLSGFMTTLENSSSSTTENAAELDYSCECNGDPLASPGNYLNSTNAWPVSPASGIGIGRIRGYINITCQQQLNYTIGLLANDSATLSIEGTTIVSVNWIDGQWKKFRYVQFPEPGLYAFEIQWASNHNCQIDPLEVVWSEGYLAGYNNYDTMCSGSNCLYGNNSTIPDFTIIEGSYLVPSTTGAMLSCQQCNSNADCNSNTTCNSAGLCE